MSRLISVCFALCVIIGVTCVSGSPDKCDRTIRDGGLRDADLQKVASRFISKQDQKPMDWSLWQSLPKHPVLIVPGVGGSIMYLGSETSLDCDAPSGWKDSDIWVPSDVLTVRFEEWLNIMKLDYDNSTGALSQRPNPNDWANCQPVIKGANRDCDVYNVDTARPSMPISHDGLSAADNVYDSFIYKAHEFSGLIQGLKLMGYVPGENLFASPYDFRFAPVGPTSSNEDCVGTDYRTPRANGCLFARLVRLIEYMYEKNNQTRVVVMAHSNGNAVMTHLLRFGTAAQKKTLLKCVETYVSIAGPHLGALKALKSVTTGVGFGPVSSDYARVLAQNWGVQTWNFPRAAMGGQPFVVERASYYADAVTEAVRQNQSVHLLASAAPPCARVVVAETSVFGSFQIQCLLGNQITGSVVRTSGEIRHVLSTLSESNAALLPLLYAPRNELNTTAQRVQAILNDVLSSESRNEATFRQLFAPTQHSLLHSSLRGLSLGAGDTSVSTVEELLDFIGRHATRPECQ